MQNRAAPSVREIVCSESDDSGADDDSRLRQGVGIGDGGTGE
jgi:hypothetical protein